MSEYEISDKFALSVEEIMYMLEVAFRTGSKCKPGVRDSPEVFDLRMKDYVDREIKTLYPFDVPR